MMKKAIAAVIAALMMLPCAGQVCAADEAALNFGDPNDDGNIDAKDASFILAAYSRLSTGEEGVLTAAQITAADVKTDGNVDAKDASAILAYYSYLSTGGTYTLPVYLGYEKPEEYELRIENITKSADVFNAFADSMSYDIQRGARIQIPDCNAERYWMYGKKEAKVALLLLNMDEQYENGVLSEVFKDYSDYEIKNGILYLYRMAMIEETGEVTIDWNDYTKDTETAEYMNKIMKAASTARNTGNCEELDKLLKAYIDGEYENYAATLITIGYGARIEGNSYRSIYSDLGCTLFEFCGNQYQEGINQLIR